MPQSGLVISQMQGVTSVSFREASILDGSVVERIGEELYALVDQRACRKIILDFRHVKFLSSSMLGVVLALHKKSQAIQGKVVICGLRGELGKVFKIMKLDKLLEFAENETDAIGRFDATRA